MSLSALVRRPEDMTRKIAKITASAINTAKDNEVESINVTARETSANDLDYSMETSRESIA